MAEMFDRKKADAGATELDFKGGEAVLDLLKGLPLSVCMNILMNVTAMVIIQRCKTETEAMDEARVFRRELERCIGVNWPVIAARRGGQ